MKAPRWFAILFFLALLSSGNAQPLSMSVPPPVTGSEGLWEKTSLPPEKREAIRRALGTRDFKRAETILVKQIDAEQSLPSPQAANLLVLAARIFLVDKDPANSAIAFKKAEKIRPLEAPDRFSLAMAFIGIGRQAWARPELARLAAEQPDEPKHLYWLARIDYDDRQYDAAVRLLQKVTALSPGFIRGWDNLALAQEGAGRLEEAADGYKHAVELNRKEAHPSPWPPLNFGILLTRMGKLEDAENLLREALRYDGQMAAAYHRLGVALDKKGQPEQALVELRKATELAPTDPAPFYALGQIYRDRGNMAAAEEAFAKFRKLKEEHRGNAPSLE